ncbi:hypothetical protein WJX72_000072 [[Myrmecia] bisecta]|uniref:Uncharacterized protein n=1 Tax=[Myrmecia] bisecta TaxID=41462 RepID=A0AAW1R444_9CHLO
MTFTNLVITAGVVGSIIYLMKADVRTGSTLLRRNLRHIRSWLDEAQNTTSQAAKHDIKQFPEQKPDVSKPADPPKP